MKTMYKIRVLLRFFFESNFEMFRNSMSFIGWGPRKFKNYPETLKGKIVVITGCNTGIGKETVKVLARLGAKVIMACRDTAKAHIAAKDISKEIAKDIENADIVVMKLDLSSFASIRQFAREINQSVDKIDYLINNAGVMYTPKSQTEDGFEMQFGTNHLGHFLLTNLLIDKLKAAPKARIVTVSSIGHTTGEINFDDINLDENYTLHGAYAQSKLANILFTRELVNRLTKTDIHTYCLHPGFISTELGRYMKGCMASTTRLIGGAIFMTPEMGAQTTLYCTLEESISGETGRYYKNCRRVDNMVANATDDETARKLWELSCELVDIEYKDQL